MLLLLSNQVKIRSTISGRTAQKLKYFCWVPKAVRLPALQANTRGATLSICHVWFAHAFSVLWSHTSKEPLLGHAAIRFFKLF